MNISACIRRSMLAAPLAAFIGFVAVSPASAQGTPCRQLVAAEPGKLPVVSSGEGFGCLEHVARNLQTEASQITQQFIPSTPGCSADPNGHPNTTPITVSSFTNAGNLDFAGDFQRKDAVIVARISNNSGCATAGRIRLLPHRSYYLIVEHRGRDARLVTSDGEIRLGRFVSCRVAGFPDAANRPREHVAMIKIKNADPSRGECNHEHRPDARLGLSSGGAASVFHLASEPRAVQGPLEWVIWMTCGGDCCYADL